MTRRRLLAEDYGLAYQTGYVPVGGVWERRREHGTIAQRLEAVRSASGDDRLHS